MKKLLDYLVLVLIVGLMMFLSSCEKDYIEPLDDSIVIEEPSEVDTMWNPIEFEDIDPFLSTPAEDAHRVVNVVVINYIPTKDKGQTLDQYTFPWRGNNGQLDMDLPVSEYKKWLLTSTIRTKFAFEEGTKFRGYKSNSRPSVGIKVLKYINVYEMPKIERQMPSNLFAVDSTEGYFPDYNKLFADIGMDTLVNNHDVKEVWFNRKSLAVPESNMSSPSSGDISNPYFGSSQYGFNNTIDEYDLPIYDKTYVVYSHWMHNSYDKNLHVRGHQVEAQMNQVDGNDFIWGKFKGQVNTSDGRTRGCGTVHLPPNATSGYQYNNTHYILSDIEDWNPEGTGQQTEVNNSNWVKNYTINYNFPTSTYHGEVQRNVVGNDPEGGWLMYWYQSIPGYDNGIEYGDKELKNFWDVIYDWDYHFTNDKDLLK